MKNTNSGLKKTSGGIYTTPDGFSAKRLAGVWYLTYPGCVGADDVYSNLSKVRDAIDNFRSANQGGE